MKLGDHVYTPRFCTVTINAIFENPASAYQAGYREPTYWENPEWEIRGKSTGMYSMEFAAIKLFPVKK